MSHWRRRRMILLQERVEPCVFIWPEPAIKFLDLFHGVQCTAPPLLLLFGLARPHLLAAARSELANRRNPSPFPR